MSELAGILNPICLTLKFFFTASLKSRKRRSQRREGERERKEVSVPEDGHLRGEMQDPVRTEAGHCEVSNLAKLKFQRSLFA